MQDWKATVISQYANSPTLLALIENINECIDPSRDIDAFYRNIWNIDTATGYGLEVWGRIVGVSRSLEIPTTIGYFGFDTTGTDHWETFGSGQFYSGVPASQNYSLSDNAYRALILIKALANIAATNIPSLNRLIRMLFANLGSLYFDPGYVDEGYVSGAGNDRCYVVDLGNMRMAYVFEFALTPLQMAVLTSSGVLPRPTGVAAYATQIDIQNAFGFAEMPGAQTFGYGTFSPEPAYIY